MTLQVGGEVSCVCIVSLVTGMYGWSSTDSSCEMFTDRLTTLPARALKLKHIRIVLKLQHRQQLWNILISGSEIETFWYQALKLKHFDIRIDLKLQLWDVHRQANHTTCTCSEIETGYEIETLWYQDLKLKHFYIRLWNWNILISGSEIETFWYQDCFETTTVRCSPTG